MPPGLGGRPERKRLHPSASRDCSDAYMLESSRPTHGHTAACESAKHIYRLHTCGLWHRRIQKHMHHDRHTQRQVHLEAAHGVPLHHRSSIRMAHSCAARAHAVRVESHSASPLLSSWAMPCSLLPADVPSPAQRCGLASQQHVMQALTQSPSSRL
jgi:hypothetical protein